MTRRVRSAFGRFLALSCASALTLLILASSLAAQQTTGKIEGTVTDDKGAALGNAQVSIVGTSFNVLTDNKGYYFINNVPVGTYTMRAKFIGYTPVEVTGLRVLGGQTVTSNFKLTPSAVAIGPVTVEAAANPIVPRDQVTSKTTITNVGQLPVDDVRQVIALTPGVVESGSGAGLVLRGGRPGEANVYIDGAPVRNSATGTQQIEVNRNAVEEASVTTGALGVDFGDAQSGVIAYQTRAGGQKLQGSVSYQSDEPFGNSISVGFNRFEGSLGGPVPHVSNLTWFVSGVVQGQVSEFSRMGQDSVPTWVMGGLDTTVHVTQADGSLQPVAIPRFVQYSGQCGQLGSAASPAAQAIQSNYGIDCQGRRLPLDWNTVTQFQGKLQFSYGSGSNISVTGLSSGNQFRRSPGQNLSDPLSYFGEHDWGRLVVANWSHSVYKEADRALALNVNLSYGQDRRINGPLDPAYESTNRSPTMGMDFNTMQFDGISSLPFPITDNLISTLRKGNTSGVGVIPLPGRQDLALTQGNRLNPYGVNVTLWPTSGIDIGGLLESDNRYRAFAQVDWQANRFHRFDFGGEYKKSDLTHWGASLTNLGFIEAYIGHPVTWGAWASDRLDLGDVVLELGLRYDYLDSKALFPLYPGSTYTNALRVCANGASSCPVADSTPSWSPFAASNPLAYDSSLARVYRPASSHHTLSPRLRVSFPITDKTDFRLSYSHQVQTPDFNTMLSGSNSDLTFTNQNDAFGRDVTFGKTILFEFGVRHAFNPGLVLDVSAYNKDKVSDLAYRIVKLPDPTRANPDSVWPAGAGLNAINLLTNADFGYARGIDLRLDSRAGNWFNASVAYTFQLAQSTGSDPFAYLNTLARSTQQITGFVVPPPEQPLPTDDNREHNLVGAVTVTVPPDWQQGTTLGHVLRNVGVFATFRAVSGLPYTRLFDAGIGVTAPRSNFGLGGANPVEPINSSTMPWQKSLDLRVNKGFRLGRTDVTVFADGRNILNFRNVDRLFNETGDVVNATHRAHFVAPELAGLAGEASTNSALDAATGTINVSDCRTWTDVVDCVLLSRTEARFGNGDGLYTLAEQNRAVNAEYNLLNGLQQLLGVPRSIRLGVQVDF